MTFLRNHWFDLGIILALITVFFLLYENIDVHSLQFLLWLSLIFLFIHQFEEYRYPGYFPGMINMVMFNSEMPDRFPLNSNTSLVINILVGWLCYALAAIFYDKAIWLGIATILVSLGNFVAHTFVFNIKGKTIYNPGMITSIVLFLPIVIYIFYFINANHVATATDYVIGILLGIALNYIGILKLIVWMENKNTPYIFLNRQLRPQDRK